MLILNRKLKQIKCALFSQKTIWPKQPKWPKQLKWSKVTQSGPHSHRELGWPKILASHHSSQNFKSTLFWDTPQMVAYFAAHSHFIVFFPQVDKYPRQTKSTAFAFSHVYAIFSSSNTQIYQNLGLFQEPGPNWDQAPNLGPHWQH